jgi:PhnB protein
LLIKITISLIKQSLINGIVFYSLFLNVFFTNSSNKKIAMKIPDYYLPIMPYLIISKAADFIEFVKEVFDADIKLIVPREEGVIMHGELTIGKAAILFADATETYAPRPAGMFLLISNVDEVYHKALAHGAASLQKPTNMDYGYSAGFQDDFGNQWWLTKAG